jgi:hypothetical protein
MFLYEVELRRKTLQGDNELAMMSGRRTATGIYESDPEEAVRTSWCEDGLWSSNWLRLPPPGALWPYESRDAKYEVFRHVANMQRVAVIMPGGSKHYAYVPDERDVDLRTTNFGGGQPREEAENARASNGVQSAPIQERVSSRTLAPEDEAADELSAAETLH